MVGARETNTVHCDWFCPRSVVSREIVDNSKARPMPKGIDFKINWGHCKEFTCNRYIDVEFTDPLKKRVRMPVRLHIVDDPAFDKKRVIFGSDFLCRYLQSKKGHYENGDVLFGDNRGRYWATTYQKKSSWY